MRKTLMSAYAIAGVLAAACTMSPSAKADVIYTYTGLPTYTGQNGAAAVGVTLVLDITDAAVASGSFSLSGYGSLGSASYDGDASGLVSFTTSAGFTATQSGIDGGGLFDISFTFGSTGTILSDTISYTALDGDGDFSGNQSLTSGTIGSDALGCDSDASSGKCTVSGTFTTATTTTSTSVSEPSSKLLLLGCVLAAVAIRPKRFGVDRQPRH
ncbi:MAG: hypothetical protein ACRYG8_43415 [Janthinobacterium lividum]